MIYLAVALVLMAGMFTFLVNKFLDQRQQELDKKDMLNTQSIDMDTVAALEERLNKFDERINNTWNNTSSIKQELDALKLAIGIRNKV